MKLTLVLCGLLLSSCLFAQTNQSPSRKSKLVRSKKCGIKHNSCTTQVHYRVSSVTAS